MNKPNYTKDADGTITGQTGPLSIKRMKDSFRPHDFEHATHLESEIEAFLVRQTQYYQEVGGYEDYLEAREGALSEFVNWVKAAFGAQE